MRIEFSGPARRAEHGSILQDARVNGQLVICQFISEVLHECDPDHPYYRSLDRFHAHRERLLAIAARKIEQEPVRPIVNIFTSDVFAHLPDFSRPAKAVAGSHA